MDKNEKTLIYILSLAIHGKKATDFDFDKIEWEEILKEAKAHDVQAFLYSVLKDVPNHSDLWDKFLDELKRITMVTTSRMMQHNYHISKVLLRLKEAEIPVIAFKGVVLKDMYPYPELRTMGDADLLVPEEYIDLSKKVLEEIGYRNCSKDAKHVVMISSNGCVIELHWTLVNHEVYNYIPESFEKDIWRYKIPAIVGGVEIFTLGLEDHLLFLCHHMRTHMIHSGFGIRQICDFVLFSESIMDTIDWESFFNKADKLKIAYFAAAIFEIAEQLFELKVPSSAAKYKNSSQTIDELLNYIIRSGNFGSRVVRGLFNRDFLADDHKRNDGTNTKSKSIMKRIDSLISRIRNRYNYSLKSPWLTPVACVQFLIVEVFLFIPKLIKDRRRNKMFSDLNLK